MSNIAGDLIEVGTDNEGRVLYKMIRIILMSICPRELHVLMIKPVKEGGFEGAYDQLGNVMYSIMTLWHYWFNWRRVMTEADMSVCACKCCTTKDDLHHAYVAKMCLVCCPATKRNVTRTIWFSEEWMYLLADDANHGQKR